MAGQFCILLLLLKETLQHLLHSSLQPQSFALAIFVSRGLFMARMISCATETKCLADMSLSQGVKRHKHCALLSRKEAANSEKNKCSLKGQKI